VPYNDAVHDQRADRDERDEVNERADVDDSRQRLAARDVVDEHLCQMHERDVAPREPEVAPASTLSFTGSTAFPFVSRRSLIGNGVGRLARTRRSLDG
jgi:hypothetical protein